MDRLHVSSSPNNPWSNETALTSVINALESVENRQRPIIIVVENHYVIKGINEWIEPWIQRGWRNKRMTPIANKKLWMKLYELQKRFVDIKFVKFRGGE